MQGRTSLSLRGEALLASPPFPEYLQEHFDRLDGIFDSVTNAEGYIPLSVAENKLPGLRLLERMAEVSQIPARVLGYDSMIGSMPFRHQLANFLGRTVFGRKIEPKQLAVLAGAGSILEILFHNLCDPGDGVLVPTPSYAGFWADLETRDKTCIVPVATHSHDGFQLTPNLLDQAIAEAGRPVKALLFTNPNNPLGTVSSPAEIEAIIDWGAKTGVHLVFDEVYALSVYGDRSFTSCAQIRPELGESIHAIWAFSKDFGASGLRCGVLLSGNERLLQAMDSLGYWACVSGHTQYLLGEVISDDRWVDCYIADMQAGLDSAYREVTAALDGADLSYIPAAAGFFLLCDLRRFLAEPTWEAERALWRRLLEEGNVNLTPGESCHNAEPGFLRLCFASCPTDVVVAGVRRLASVLSGLDH